MIPTDVLSRLQIAGDAAPTPVASIREITDKLFELPPGQRVMAEIQAFLSNGTYRATINQREVVLALPFSAKSGDTLELEVVNHEGKLAFAVLSRPKGGSTEAHPESVSTTLSRTGQLIATLFNKAQADSTESLATPLNENQPIVKVPPGAPQLTTQSLLPLLKQAITQSGMFYESHQVAWLNGETDQQALRQEPQGKLSTPNPSAQMEGARGAQASLQPTLAGGSPASAPLPASEHKASAHSPQAALMQARYADQAGALTTTQMRDPSGADALGKATEAAAEASTDTNKTANTHNNAATSLAHKPLVAPELLPLVQQQLEALATQHFAWQGEIWPGQKMRWEISEAVDEEAARQRGQKKSDDEAKQTWQTRLRLTLPNLGAVDAQIELRDQQIGLQLSAVNPHTEALLRTASQAFRKQLDQAGLTLTSLSVSAEVAETTASPTQNAETTQQSGQAHDEKNKA
ncbi:MAG: flagellar hook-length control protein FliK [Pseudomonadota bacterium]